MPQTEDQHKKSLELLDKFIAETPPAELTRLIAQYENLDIKGPTFDEYLNNF